MKPKNKKRLKLRSGERTFIIIKAKTVHSDENLYRSPKYKKWRKAVFKRDHWKCQLCGQVGGSLEAHHIKPKSRFPSLMLVIDNGVCLCLTCHSKLVTGNEVKFEKLFTDIVGEKNGSKSK